MGKRQKGRQLNAFEDGRRQMTTKQKTTLLYFLILNSLTKTKSTLCPSHEKEKRKGCQSEALQKSLETSTILWSCDSYEKTSLEKALRTNEEQQWTMNNWKNGNKEQCHAPDDNFFWSFSFLSSFPIYSSCMENQFSTCSARLLWLVNSFLSSLSFQISMSSASCNHQNCQRQSEYQILRLLLSYAKTEGELNLHLHTSMAQLD